jgi:hypothetical protein
VENSSFDIRVEFFSTAKAFYQIWFLRHGVGSSFPAALCCHII